MPGLLIDGIKYMRLHNDNNFKKKSLYDNIYFTLRDIFVNAESVDDFMEANSYNHKITGGICFEERSENFEYKKVLFQKEFIGDLQRWLESFDKENSFEFTEPEDDDPIFINEIDEKEYIKLEDWWFQFEELKKLIKQFERN
jgi:hypothetical protein